MYTTGIQGYFNIPWLSLSTSSKVCSPWIKKGLTNIYCIMNFKMNLKIKGRLCLMGWPHQHHKVSRYKTCIFTSTVSKSTPMGTGKRT